MQLNEILKEFLEKEKIFKFNLEDLKKNQFDNKFNKDLEFKIFKLKNKINELEGDNLNFYLKSNRLVDSQVEYGLIGLIYKEKVIIIIIN
jgi:hypothetical protein